MAPILPEPQGPTEQNQPPLDNFFASRIGLARIGSFEQLKNKLGNKENGHPSYAINLALDDDILFSAATKVDLLPPIEEAQDGLFYIKSPENILYFPSLDTDPQEWIQVSSNSGGGGGASVNITAFDETIDILNLPGEIKISAASAVSLANNYALGLVREFESKKVDKEEGKGLSTNDYTNEEKDKLANVESQAQKNKIEVIKDAGGQIIPINNGEVQLPASATVDAYTKTESNDKFVAKVIGKTLTTEDYTTQEKTKLTSIEENAQVNKIEKIKKASGEEIVISNKEITLPDFALKTDISSVYKVKGSKANYSEIEAVVDKEVGDVYNAQDTSVNYVWNGTEWDSLGGTVDLSNYYTKTELYTQTQINEKLDTKVDKEVGKTLTTNDFTTELKTKLENIEEFTADDVETYWNS